MPSGVGRLAVSVVKDPELLKTSTTLEASNLGISASLELLHLDRRVGESLDQLLGRLGPERAAEVEANCLQFLDAFTETGKKALLLRMYHHLNSGRWAHGARTSDCGDDFRSYIYYLLLRPDRPGGIAYKRTEISRLVDVCLLTQQLYLQVEGRFVWRERLGLDDSFFLPNVDDSLVMYGDRWGRVAYSLLKLSREMGATRDTYESLTQMLARGGFDPNSDSDEARLWRTHEQWRAVFFQSIDLSQPVRALDRAAAGSEQLAIPPLVIREPLTPAQRIALSRLPFVKLPEEAASNPLFEVRYQLELLPVCPGCQPTSLCVIRPDLDGTNLFSCPRCGEQVAEPPNAERWWVRWETRSGMTGRFLADPPRLEDWTPSTITVAGVRSVFYSTWAPRELIEELEQRYREGTQDEPSGTKGPQGDD